MTSRRRRTPRRLTFAVACEGRGITTVEGMAPGELDVPRRAFIAHDAAQCDFCTRADEPPLAPRRVLQSLVAG